MLCPFTLDCFQMPPKKAPSHFVGRRTVEDDTVFDLYLIRQVVRPKPKVGIDVSVQEDIGNPTLVHVMIMGSAELCKGWIAIRKNGQYNNKVLLMSCSIRPRGSRKDYDCP